MGTTANLGAVYPDTSGVPSRQAWVEDPIKSLDAKIVEYLAKHFKSGSVTAVASGLAQGSGVGPFNVVFPTPFAVIPRVTVSLGSAPGGSQYLVPRVTNTTANGFAIYVYNVGPTAATASVAVNWDATDFGNA